MFHSREVESEDLRQRFTRRLVVLRSFAIVAPCHFFVGFGVGGLYCVDLPLVQEFVPASRRGFIGGLVTAFIPIGVMIGTILGAFLAPPIGWRGLFGCGLFPAALTLLIRAWVPESPRWLVRMGRPEEARRSLAWALQVPAASPAIAGAR